MSNHRGILGSSALEWASEGNSYPKRLLDMTRLHVASLRPNKLFPTFLPRLTFYFMLVLVYNSFFYLGPHEGIRRLPSIFRPPLGGFILILSDPVHDDPLVRGEVHSVGCSFGPNSLGPQFVMKQSPACKTLPGLHLQPIFSMGPRNEKFSILAFSIQGSGLWLSLAFFHMAPFPLPISKTIIETNLFWWGRARFLYSCASF